MAGSRLEVRPGGGAFRHGDVNAGGSTDLSDGVRTLSLQGDVLGTAEDLRLGE